MLVLLCSCVIKEKKAPGTKLDIAGMDTDGGYGVFDPAVAQDPLTSRLWLTYSAIDPAGADQWLGKFNRAVSSRLAFSEDGINWQDTASISPATAETLDVSGSSQRAIWGSETSSIVYDRSAPEKERWKVIWHRFLTVEGLPRFDFGWLSIKVSATAEGLSTASEEKFISSYLYSDINDSRNSRSRPPVGGAPVLTAGSMLNELSTSICVEPALFATDSALYLAMACNDIEHKFWRIPLFRCQSPCNYRSPNSWSHVANLLTTDVGRSMGFKAFSAPSLFEKDGRKFIIATPVVEKDGNDSHYSGCHVFEFSDIDAGTLIQDQSGNPQVIKTIGGLSGSFHGACGYHAGMEGSGILYSQLWVEHALGFFSIYKSHQNVP